MEDISKYQEQISLAYEELKELFGFPIEGFAVKVAINRQEFDDLVGRKTASWEVGNAVAKDTIIILSPDSWSTDSPEHSPEELSGLLRHELAHLFIDHLAKDKPLPRWLNEGLAVVLGRQEKILNNKKLYLESGFCRLYDTPLGWNNYRNAGAYNIATLFVKFLVDRYDLEKIKELIKASPKFYLYSHFDEEVTKIFGQSLAGLERDFFDELKKK